MKKGKVILIVGKKGSGKSTEIKKLLNTVPKRENIFMIDPNAEHTEYYDTPISDFKQFGEQALTLKNKVIVIEESTIFLGHWKNTDIQKLLVLSRHSGNTVLMVFHSFADVPKYIYRLSNIIVIKKTNDLREKLESFDDSQLIDKFWFVKESDNEYETIYHEYA